VPEVMVKVSGGARSLGGVAAHLAYIGRDGKLGVEMDDGQRIAGLAAGDATAIIARRVSGPASN
ncbi:MAG TPA: hypothetical protein VGO18_07575, partial [Steroidobacteraceae bacterium]|nr:hypothetical protein [Steroidobacteraceae bacterium]